MRIGLRVSPRSSGGGRVFVDRLAQAIGEQPGGHEAVVFTMGKGSVFTVERQIEVPVPRHPAGRRLLGDRALAQAISADPIDVLVCPGTEVGVVKGLPSVMWPLTVAPFEEAAMRQLGRSPRSVARWKVLRATLRQAAGRADAFVFSSHYARALYGDHVPAVRRAPSTVVPPAASVMPSPDPVRMEGLPKRYVLFVSHLYPYKMVLETVEGFALARQAGIEQHLVLAGNATQPEYGQAVRDLVERLGLGDVVHLLGGVPSELLPGLYRDADLFVFPSISENAGSYALIDAFALGRPVLSSSMSSMPEACQNGARYFDPRDPQQLAEELINVLTRPAVMAQLQSASVERGRDYSGWDDVAARLLAFLGTI